MNEKEVAERLAVGNLDEMSALGSTSCSSKESEAENVDAIKKFIEEQEILLRLSSNANDLVNSAENRCLIGHDQNECESLEQQLTFSNDSQTPTKYVQEKQTISSPNKFSSVSMRNEEISHTQSQNPMSYDPSLELEEEQILANQAAENLLSLSQNCIKMQINIKGKKHFGELIDTNAHEHTSSMAVITEIQNEGLSAKFECNETNIEFKKSPKNTKEEQQLSKENQIEPQEVDSIDSKEDSNESETKSMCSEYDNSEQPKLLHQLLTSKNSLKNEIDNCKEFKDVIPAQDHKEHSEETLAIATSVMDMILNDTEAAINQKRVSSVLPKQLSPEKVNSSVSLAIGSKVEAKDFCELWHPAQIVEVDCEEMEVLVQYDNQPKKHNEWISISSPRLRPIANFLTKSVSPPHTTVPEENTEPKVEDKQKVTFAVGERCLARWRDNRRFIATIHNDLGNGSYEVMFDDGFQWKCTLSRLYKLKESSGQHDWAGSGACPPVPAPASEPAPAPPQGPLATPPTNGHSRLPLYHTHLFDPTRDYLGSKSERREMKRKLNIKEIFNIGQKRKKLPSVDKEPKNTICIKEDNRNELCAVTPTLEAPRTATPQIKETSTELLVKKAIKKKPPVKKKTLARKKIKLKHNVKSEAPSNQTNNETLNTKTEIPEAVASIIGSVCKSEPIILEVKSTSPSVETKDSNANDIKPDEHTIDDLSNSLDASQTMDKQDTDDAITTEPNLEKFDLHDGVKHEEVIGKIKEVITKLEDGINQVEKNEVKPEENIDATVADGVRLDVQPTTKPSATTDKEKPKKSSSKVKKGKKLRMLQKKKVKKQVEQVKCQLEEMKKQMEAMRQEIMLKTEELANSRLGAAAPEECLPAGEWCCRWVDGQPVGAVSEVECDPAAPAAAPPGAAPPLPRRSVQVEDKRLPLGWTKHMVRRSLGNSAGKWDVVLVSPENRRFHTKNDMRVYLENNAEEGLKPFEAALMDFGIHLKLSRRMGWVGSSAEGAPPPPRPSPALAHSSPLLKRKKLTLDNTRKHRLMHHKKRKLNIKPLRPPPACVAANVEQNTKETNWCSDPGIEEEATLDGASITDGFVHVGSLRVQVIETLLRCPAEGCFKNFRNTMLLKMHIKHYHRELRKTMGNTPKVLDLAYARTRPTEAEMKRLKCEAQQRIIKVKLPRLHKRVDEQTATEPKDVKIEATPDPLPSTPALPEEIATRSLDSPKLRNALVNKPAKRPRVLLPVRSKEPEPAANEASVASDQPPIKLEDPEMEDIVEPKQEVPDCGELDFETAISSHTVSKMVNGIRCKSEKKRKTFARIPKLGASEDEEWAGAGSDPDTRSSYPSCGTPDSRAEPDLPADDQDPHRLYMYTEAGERIKLVRMRREEIINCHCGFREEDGLMVQCELCLCWQHALCHNIQREAEVPEKYTCSICLNPRRGRRRQRFLHDQDRLYEGLLPGPGGGRASDALRRAHELSGNLLRLADALHAVRVNTTVAMTKNHPKLYLWARDWETVELTFAQEKLNSEYSDLNVIINNLGKENLPMKAEDLKEMALDIKTPPSDEMEEKHGQRESLSGSQALLSGLLSSPGGAALDLPVSESDLDKLAKSVQEQESAGAGARAAPQPEAAIENSACRARLLRHVQRCHALLDQRLDSIEAQVAELESQDASLEDDETADFYPRTKQTMQMISRDLDAMEELGIIT